MTQLMKKFGLLLILAFTTFFSSCEKDLYEEAIINDVQENKINHVTIDDVPFLIPSVEEFKTNMRNPNNPNGIAYRGISDFELELQNIIEFVNANGYKTYSIPIKDDGTYKEDYYFENLHLLKIDDQYKFFVLQYNQTDDSEKFDMTTFTGKVKLFDQTKEYIGEIDYSNGLKLIPTDETGFGDGNSGGGGPHGSFWTWLYNLFFGGDHYGDLGLSAGSSSNSSSSSSGSEYIVIWSGNGTISGGGNNTTNTTNNNGNFSGGNVGVVPVYEWPTETTQITMANLISDRLSLTSAEKSWLKNANNQEITLQIYNYLNDADTSEINSFVNEVIDKMIQNPDVFHSINSFLIEKNIDDTALPPCSKNILSVIKNLSHNDFAKIIARLGSTDSIYSVFINPIQNFNLNTGNLAETSIVDVNNLYSYNISIDSQYLTQGTKLSIASTILHELIHAYFYSLIADEYNTGNSTLNTFPELWDYYVVNMSNMTPGGSPQHLVMAQNYVNVLGEALQEFDTGVPVTSSSPLQQKYKDLAWGGLYGTTPYNSLSQSEKDRITAVNIAEETNSSQIENGTTHLPISTPCN